MADQQKDQKGILAKLGIDTLNEMQESAAKAIASSDEVMLTSPTGTGKTLAYLLPILKKLDPNIEGVQVLILVPSRELAIQIEQVMREMGSGVKVNAVYGGRSGNKDRIDLKHEPTVLVGTPGRVADHLRRETVSANHIKTLVFDEFDKSLEIGFAAEMIEILLALPALKQKILTSATNDVAIPAFVKLKDPKRLDFKSKGESTLALRLVVSDRDKTLEALAKLLGHLGPANGIIFCNYKDTIRGVSEFLTKKGFEHGCFFGGLEQLDRERALIQFRNGTHRLLLATDLAARGIDVPELDFIIHFQLPPKETEFIHRNGRTARMHQNGTAYIIAPKRAMLPEFVSAAKELTEFEVKNIAPNAWTTLYISGGRKDKISKGDVAGLFIKQGKLTSDELGVIELQQQATFVAVKRNKAEKLAAMLNNSRLKKKKVRISVLK